MMSPSHSAKAGLSDAIPLTTSVSCGGCGHVGFAGRLSPATTNVNEVAFGFVAIGFDPAGPGASCGIVCANTLAAKRSEQSSVLMCGNSLPLTRVNSALVTLPPG